MANNNAYNNFANLFQGFQAPDLNKYFDQGRRTVETSSAVVQTVVEGAQEASRRGAAAFRDNVEQTLKASRDLLSSGTPEAGVAKMSEIARSMFESTVINLREVTELLTKTGFEAFDLINQRASEAFSEAPKASSKRK